MNGQRNMFLSTIVFTAITSFSFDLHAGLLSRLRADFLNFDDTETLTNVKAAANCTSAPCVPGSPDGALFYRKTVSLPKGDNVIYVSYSGTSDVHDDAALMMSCRIDGAFCNPGQQGASAGPAGWVTLQNLPFDRHDNSTSVTWCIPVDAPKSRLFDIDLKLASSTGGNVFFENAHIYIDSSYNRGGCTAYRLPETQVRPNEVKASIVKRQRH